MNYPSIQTGALSLAWRSLPSPLPSLFHPARTSRSFAVSASPAFHIPLSLGGLFAVAPFSSISFTFPLRPPLSAEYPWQVAILKKEEFDNVYLCGGSLIDGSHIVTAAHCVDDFKPNELR